VILLALALASLAVQEPPATSAGDLSKTCLAGVGGDRGSSVRCGEYIDAVATGLSESGETSCLAQTAYDPEAAMWAYVDWLAENPQDPTVDASAGVMTALVSKWPCGWTKD
jgi:hypothetical protein